MEASIVERTQLGHPFLCFPHALVVGHDHTCIQEIQRKLLLCSFRVTILTQPSTAIFMLRKIRGGYFQLLIIDIDRSPDLASFMNLKQFGLQMGLPVVMTSKQENHSLMKRVLQSGVCCFLVKPIDVELLRSTCDQYALKKNLLLQNAISKIWPKKERMIWDLDLHHRFLEIISKLGPKNCSPMNILELMNVPGLTRTNVSSHLQRYLNCIKKSPTGEYFPNYFIPSKDLPSSSNDTPKHDYISLNHDQSVTKNLHNTDLTSIRRNVVLYENPNGLLEFNPINNDIEMQSMNVDKGGNDSLNFDIDENFSTLNEINVDGISNDRPEVMMSDGIIPEFTTSLDLTLLNFDNDIDRPTSPYPPFPESYDQVPDVYSPTFTYAIDQMFSSSEPHQVLENNQSQPNLCFGNVEPAVSFQFQTNVEFDSSNLEYLYSIDKLDIPANFSNSNQVTRSTIDDVQWVVGSNPNNDGDDNGLFDWVSGFNIQGSSFPSQQFDEVDFEGLFF